MIFPYPLCYFPLKFPTDSLGGGGACSLKIYHFTKVFTTPKQLPTLAVPASCLNLRVKSFSHSKCLSTFYLMAGPLLVSRNSSQLFAQSPNLNKMFLQQTHRLFFIILWRARLALP